jgi:hypothetical protein
VHEVDVGSAIGRVTDVEDADVMAMFDEAIDEE